MSDEWKTIDSAPRDGTKFHAYWPCFFDNDAWDVCRTWFDPERGTWETPTCQAPHDDPEAPTHWRSLIEPPTHPEHGE